MFWGIKTACTLRMHGLHRLRITYLNSEPILESTQPLESLCGLSQARVPELKVQTQNVLKPKVLCFFFVLNEDLGAFQVLNFWKHTQLCSGKQDLPALPGHLLISWHVSHFQYPIMLNTNTETKVKTEVPPILSWGSLLLLLYWRICEVMFTENRQININI